MRFLNGIWRRDDQPRWKPGQTNAGCFILNPGTPQEQRVWNTIVEDGADNVLRTIFRGESVLTAAFYLGLTSASYEFDDADLVDIEADEPVGNGYARQTLTRNTTDWGAPSLENNAMRILSKSVTFTASSAWNVPWTRMFLASVASGAGEVFSLSGALAPQTVLSGAGPTLRYEHWCRA